MAKTPRQLTSAPLAFRFSRWLARNGLRGATRVERLAERLGWLDAVVTYRLPQDTCVQVPIWRGSNRCDYHDVLSYEKKLMDQLAEEANRLAEPVCLIDCGADLGLVPALLRSRGVAFSRIVALEPNPVAFEYLRANLALLSVPAEARLAAVSDQPGRGVLRRSPTDQDDHARYLEATRAGEIAVTTVAHLGVQPGDPVLLKVDVEGGEEAVLRGALPVLAQSRRWIVAFEAHRDVWARTGIDPVECIRLLQSVCPCRFRVAELPGLELSLHRGYHEQVKEPRVTNVVCVAGSPRA